MRGIVTKIVKKKRNRNDYGFIDAYDGETYFFLLKYLKEDVRVGQEVFFTGSENEKGFFAKDIHPISE